MGRVRILREADVRALLDMPACIEACERAFAAYSTGGAELPDVIHLDVPESQGEIHVKAGHLRGLPVYAIKVASGFTVEGTSVIDGLVLVFDARDGSPVAFLLDGGYITDLRTGAAGGVAARHLAPPGAETAAILGTGGQTAMQAEALLQVRPTVRELRIWGRNADRAAVRARDLDERFGGRCAVRAAAEPVDAVRGAQVVITATAARAPLVRAEWLAPGAHVTAVGSDGVGKQELDPEILRHADLLVVDSREQCARLGELQHAADQASRAVELGAICAGDASGRTSEAQLTVCDLTGVGVQDVAAANVVWTAAGDRGDTIEV